MPFAQHESDRSHEDASSHTFPIDTGLRLIMAEEEEAPIGLPQARLYTGS